MGERLGKCMPASKDMNEYGVFWKAPRMSLALSSGTVSKHIYMSRLITLVPFMKNISSKGKILFVSSVYSVDIN